MLDLIKIYLYKLTGAPKYTVHYTLDTKGRNRPIIDWSIDGIDFRDGPRFTDSFLCEAVWDDTGKPLDDYELEHINMNDSDLVHILTEEHVY